MVIYTVLFLRLVGYVLWIPGGVLMAFGVILGLQQASGRETLWSH